MSFERKNSVKKLDHKVFLNLLQAVPFHLENAQLFHGKNKSNYKTKPIALILLAWQQDVLVPEDLFNGQTLWTTANFYIWLQIILLSISIWELQQIGNGES